MLLTLQDKGWEVQVFSFKKVGNTFTDPLRIDIKKKQNYLKNTIEVFKAIRKYKPDVVVSNFSYVNQAILSGKLLGVKKI